VNLPPAELRTFFGDEDGDELHMAFTFTVNQALYLALARGDAEPLRRALRELPALPADAAWANFARNHDELTLDKLTEEERGEVFAAFGPDPDLQLFGRGLRRRVPPMLDGDPARIRLLYSLVFSLPGTPVLFYGEEIGMGESLAIEGRMSVRSPMQWSAERHGGFTTADDPVRPLPEGPFGPERVNVAAQRRDDGSLLAFMTRLARRRRECPELGFGTSTLLDAGAPAVLARRSDWDDSTLVLLHDLGGSAVRAHVHVEGVGEGARLVDLLGPGEIELDAEGRATVDLEPHGHRWYRVGRTGQRLAP
jgi:maltose alpha-D-glucosyltransferase/alpha-amylase